MQTVVGGGLFVIEVGLFVCLLFGEDSRTRREELNFNKNRTLISNLV